MDRIKFEEEWSDIEEFPEYGVSSQGRVVNDATSRTMAINYNRQGIAMVKIQKNGLQYTRSVALLVARAFLDEPKNSSYNSIIYLNGDHTDCRAMNLMWRPRWYALKYHQMFQEIPIRVGVYVPYLQRTFSSLRDFCTTYGLDERSTYVNLNNGDPCWHYGWLLERVPV